MTMKSSFSIEYPIYGEMVTYFSFEYISLLQGCVWLKLPERKLTDNLPGKFQFHALNMHHSSKRHIQGVWDT